MYIHNSKHRAHLKSEAMKMDCVLSLGKASVSPEFTDAVAEYIKKNELIKINVLKNCADDLNIIARVISERTRSEIVQVIGRKIVLYKPHHDAAERKYDTY